MRHPVPVTARRSRLVSVSATAVLTLGIVAVGPPARQADAAALRPALVDLATLQTEQLEVLARDYQLGVDQATTALTAATGALDGATGALATQTSAAAAAATHAAAAAETLSSTIAAHDASVTAHTNAIATLAYDRGRLGQIALALYIGPPPRVPQATADVTGAQLQADAAEYLDTSHHEVSSLVKSDAKSVVTTANTERQLAVAMSKDRTTLTEADAASRQAEAEVVADRASVGADRVTLASAQTALGAAQKAQTTALTGLGGPAPDGSPTIMGTAALETAQMAGWFDSSYYKDRTAATPAQLTAWYLRQGKAEGVRGDVAFAQAVVETGGFSSPDAINLNNYAGIGHCDSCGAGLAFPSPEGGVEGQMQVLRVFANPRGTPLTQPAVIPAVAPGGEFGGGCCPSWQSLTGHYATDPLYGQTVLSVYKSILDYALGRPPVAPMAAPTIPAATPPPPTPPR